jgi:hypothetical protein
MLLKYNTTEVINRHHNASINGRNPSYGRIICSYIWNSHLLY